MGTQEAVAWKWVDGNEPTHAELIEADALPGERDSIAYHGADWPMKPEHKAIISAAPELYEACKGLIHVLNNDPNDDPARQKAVRALLEWSSVELAVEDARAAIAKAGGGV